MSDGRIIPGPGQYENQVITNMKSRAPGFSMGNRLDGKINQTPGPGAYLKDKNNFKGHYMGTASRPVNMAAEKTPGPGAYYALHSVSNVPEYSIKRQAENKYR